MTETKTIPHDRWQDHLRTLSDDNRGRAITVELVSLDLEGYDELSHAPLLAMDYTPAAQGLDSLIISTGHGGDEETVVIAEPLELCQVEDDDGRLKALEILGDSDARTIVLFEG